MIGRGLHREIERHLHPVRGAGGDEIAEILERAELRMDGVVAAERAADRIGAAGLAGLRLHIVVAAFAVLLADRMNGREVDRIEPHCRDIVEPRHRVAERRAASGHGALRARDHLVPGGKAGRRAIDNGVEDAVEPGQIRARAPFRHRLDDGCREQRIDSSIGRRERAPQARFRLAHQREALGEIGRDVLMRSPLAMHAVAPRGEEIGPGLDRVAIAPVLRQLERAGPAVIVVKPHRRRMPMRRTFGLIEDGGAEHVVSVAEDIGPDRKLIADDALDRIAAAIELGIKALDDDPRAALRP